MKLGGIKIFEPRQSRPVVLFVVNADFFFLSHRLPIALAARAAGARVVVACGETGKSHLIREAGLEFVPLPLSRKGLNPLAEARTFVFLLRLYRSLRPDVIHHVSIKPVLYGSIAARLSRAGAVVNAVSGLGFVFSTARLARLLRPFVERAYRAAFQHSPSRAIFQNPSDHRRFVDAGLVSPKRTVLILGSGVDCARFHDRPEPAGELTVVLPARMLWAKGVGEFVAAARSMRARRPGVRWALVGMVDTDNPDAVPEREIQGWVDEGVVEWWGHRDEMPEVLARAHVVVLPTYSEGLPKVLLEAAAAARPIVTTDVPGCREVVRHGVNGLLVPPRDSFALASAVETLLDAPVLRRRFGEAGRRIAEAEFSEQLVVRQTMGIYRELLGERWPARPAAAAHAVAV